MKKLRQALEINIEPTGFSTAFTDEDLSDPETSHIAESFRVSKYKALYDLAFGECEN